MKFLGLDNDKTELDLGEQPTWRLPPQSCNPRLVFHFYFMNPPRLFQRSVNLPSSAEHEVAGGTRKDSYTCTC